MVPLKSQSAQSAGWGSVEYADNISKTLQTSILDMKQNFL